MIVTEHLDEYFLLLNERPGLFAESAEYQIVTSRDIIEQYQKDHSTKIGVLYKSAYHMLIVDLIEKNDSYFTYERIVPVSLSNGVVCIPVVGDRLILLNQQRHAIRDTQICFPRGFGENGISSVANAKKELFEETGMLANECIFLGSIIPDSGISSNECDVFLCKISDEGQLSVFSEGIEALRYVSFTELEDMIKNNQINDSFTLSAFALLKAKSLLN